MLCVELTFHTFHQPALQKIPIEEDAEGEGGREGGREGGFRQRAGWGDLKLLIPV